MVQKCFDYNKCIKLFQAIEIMIKEGENENENESDANFKKLNNIKNNIINIIKKYMILHNDKINIYNSNEIDDCNMCVNTLKNIETTITKCNNKSDDIKKAFDEIKFTIEHYIKEDNRIKKKREEEKKEKDENVNEWYREDPVYRYGGRRKRSSRRQSKRKSRKNRRKSHRRRRSL